VASRSNDLYGLLGLSPRASAGQLRKAYEWAVQVERSPARLADVRRAYAVLGDPRLRSEYDRGNTVGVGVQRLYVRPGAPGPPPGPSRPTASPPGTCLSPSGGPPSKLGLGLMVAVLVVTGVTYAQSYLDGPAQQGERLRAEAAEAPQDGTWPTGFRSGTCLTGEGGVISPSQETPCSRPHRYEVIKVIDLDQVLGRPFTEADRGPAAEACAAEFRAFTGLADAAGHLHSAGVVEVPSTGVQDSSLNVCLVGSAEPRAGSALGAGR
jgi:hypothetical protein